MTEQTENKEQFETLEGEKFDISIEQVCAAILANKGALTIPISALFEDFNGRGIELTQNNEDQTLTLSLSEKIDLPTVEVVDTPAE